MAQFPPVTAEVDPTVNAKIAAAIAGITASSIGAATPSDVASAVAAVTPASLGVPTSAQLTSAIAGVTPASIGAATPASVSAAISAITAGSLGAVALIPTAVQVITPPDASTTPLEIKGLAGQAANLLQMRNSSNTVVASIANSGAVSAGTGYFNGGVKGQVFSATSVPVTAQAAASQ